jgi:hypothetical protein
MLGPLLFSLFLNELDNVLKHENAYIILYADDLAIFASTRRIYIIAIRRIAKIRRLVS